MLKVVEDASLPADELLAEAADEPLARLDTGEAIHLDHTDVGQRLRLVSGTGELLFEYDPVGHQTRVNIPNGDLKLMSERGNIELEAAGKVLMHGQYGVGLDCGDALHGNRSAIDLMPGRMNLSAPHWGLTAKRGEVAIENARLLGKRWRATLGDVGVFMKKLETRADRVRARARDVYNDVERLVQTRAGRVRTLVEDAYAVKAKTVIEKAEGDVKIDGKQILLG